MLLNDEESYASDILGLEISNINLHGHDHKETNITLEKV